MSILDKLVATIAPPESDEDRATARAEAERVAQRHAWLREALQHHRQIEAAFEEARQSPDAAMRTRAAKQLAIVLNGHAQAEETVLYPALAEHSEKAHAGMAYEEQQMTKVQMAMLEKLDPMSREWLDKLDHIRGAVLHHVYQEESNWFLDLADKCKPEESLMLAQRFQEEYHRYAGGNRLEEPVSQIA